MLLYFSFVIKNQLFFIKPQAGSIDIIDLSTVENTATVVSVYQTQCQPSWNIIYGRKMNNLTRSYIFVVLDAIPRDKETIGSHINQRFDEPIGENAIERPVRSFTGKVANNQ